MDDLISRKDAIDALGEEPIVWDEWTDEYSLGMRAEWTFAKRDIESLPSIDAVPQWIPVENGLPKEGQRVLVTIQCINGNRTVYDTDRYDVTCWRGLGRDVNIIAWMPLPKPYVEQDVIDEVERMVLDEQ